MPAMLELEMRGGCVVVWLAQGDRPVVVLDRALIEQLDATLAEVERRIAAGAVRGVVVASRAARSFVAGADLNAIMALDDAGLHEYLEYGARVFLRLSQVEVPTAAAIGGAALGGGLELAMHCDMLVGAPAERPYPVGLPEAGLKICPGWGGTLLFPARMDSGEAIRRTMTGETMVFEEARQLGLFERVAGGREALVETACAAVLGDGGGGTLRQKRDGLPARWIGRLGKAADVGGALEGLRGSMGESFGMEPAKSVAGCVRAGLAGGWEAGLAEERRSLVRLRGSKAAQEAIGGFLARGKK
jgi:enoyl-CoA hydratase/carnithine racemase